MSGGLTPCRQLRLVFLHDIFDLARVGTYELVLIVPKFVHEGLLIIHWLNTWLRNWKYGPLYARNKPIELPHDICSKEKVTRNAGRMWY